MRVVQAFARERRTRLRFREVNERYRAANHETVVLNGLYFPFVDFLSSAAMAVVLGYGGYLVFEGDIDDRHAVRVHRLPGELLRPGAAALAALQHVPRRGRRARQDHRRHGRGARGRATARAPSSFPASRATSASRTSASATGTGPRCCTASTSTSRRERRWRSSGTRARASRRSRSSSPLLRPALGPDHDRRHDLREVTQESLRRQLGIVPQEGFLFAGTVRENIALRRGRERRRRSSAARAVGAHEFIMELEDGYETEVGERGSRLSLGQRQLVAFARALLADPRILILDEATSSVDIGTERRIERALRRLLAGRTAFIIAHRLSTIRQADLIVVLELGRTPPPQKPPPPPIPGRHPGSRPARRSGGSQRRAGPGRVRDRDGR